MYLTHRSYLYRELVRSNDIILSYNVHARLVCISFLYLLDFLQNVDHLDGLCIKLVIIQYLSVKRETFLYILRMNLRRLLIASMIRANLFLHQLMIIFSSKETF